MTARILERLIDLLSRLRPLPKLGLKRIISVDPDFDRISGIRRLEPA